ncbi:MULTISPECIES: amino acid ABC transporter substrate-binding protein [unclassified Adlercreutzia]|uniref:amino acid ABC transporter substrate-binding protein n=1 Tax=unclassified Adlercreutzia TaxID=2636013 RepID=UPI0013EDAADD|nr:MULTISPECIES: amino acid ABC transporter substrate-binding protein [unclassified Adlercreutzia]
MKKKITTLVVAVAMLSLGALMLAGCSSSNASSSAASSASSAADKAATETTKLVVGFDNAYPPYGFIGDDGKETGFDLDLAAEVAKRNGWEYEQQAIDWDAKDALLNQGTINCIWNGFTMEGREADYTFSEPYMLNEQVIVVKKDSDVKALEDLAGKTVITQVDSAALDVLENDEEGGQAALAATFAELQTIGDYNNAFMQLESGMVDAVACDLSIAAYQMAANPDAYVQISEPLSSEHYAVGVKKGNTEMADQITATLKEMYEDGTVEELCKKYEEYGLTFDNWILK